MARSIAMGVQDFEKIRRDKIFYVDKTEFIREWWEDHAEVTLITRPRRFGKTLNLSMLDYFFSVKHAGRNDLFEGLSIWENTKYRELQGTYPVIFLSFANVKKDTYQKSCRGITELIVREYRRHSFLMKSEHLIPFEIEDFNKIAAGRLSEDDTWSSINMLSEFLFKHYGKRVIILLDEYDTPMQEAYVNGYWNEMVVFMRDFMNSTFKTNPYLERGLLTGITRVSTPKASLGKESMFSDLNNIKVISTTSQKYETSFGFTEDEVFRALEEFGLESQMPKVKEWYDGFRFGNCDNVYNPWSVINFLDERIFRDYWANTSSNKLASELLRKSNKKVKMVMENLLQGGDFSAVIDEEIIFNQLDNKPNAIWSLLLASGYLKIVNKEKQGGKLKCTLKLTNLEIIHTFSDMFQGWFFDGEETYNDFVQTLLAGDLAGMNINLNKVIEGTISYFDTGKKTSEDLEPERFYHGLVLGLVAELREKYIITSNRESGIGRYDVVMQADNSDNYSFIFEFKVMNPDAEKNLQDTVNEALKQITNKEYAVDLKHRGVPEHKILIYGFAFKGKEVLIDGGHLQEYIV